MLLKESFQIFLEGDRELRTDVGREFQTLAAWKWTELFPAVFILIFFRMVLGILQSFSMLG